jgi:hypothetical protein
MRGSGKHTIVLIFMAVVIGGWIGGRVLAESNEAFAASSPAKDDDADAPQLQLSPEQLRFADRYIKAVNSRDLKALRELIAPKSLACFTARTEPYLTGWLQSQLEEPISTPYTLTVEKRDEHDMPETMLFILPLPPTYQMNITTKVGDQDFVIGRPIAFQDGRWYEIAPCPTDLGMEQFVKRQQAIKKEAALVDQLYTQLKDPLLSDLKSLIARGKSKEACDKYATAAKVQRRTACEVIEKLAAVTPLSKS